MRRRRLVANRGGRPVPGAVIDRPRPEQEARSGGAPTTKGNGTPTTWIATNADAAIPASAVLRTARPASLITAIATMPTTAAARPAKIELTHPTSPCATYVHARPMIRGPGVDSARPNPAAMSPALNQPYCTTAACFT